MALGSVTTSRTFIRPPHFEQTVTSTAKTRARRCDQLSRYGVPVASRRLLGRHVSKSSGSCVGASGCGEDGMTRALRLWLGIEELASAMEGVLLRNGTTLVSVVEGSIDGEVDPNAQVLLAHPMTVDDGEWRGCEPSWQRDRPTYTKGDMPELGDASPRIAHADWLKRCRALGYSGHREQRAVVRTSRTIGMVTLSHSGYGHGYGDKSEQELREVSFPQAPAAVVSEAVWDIRRLLGVDPLKPKKPKKR